MFFEGSMPMIWSKWDENGNVERPGPQPRSTSVRGEADEDEDEA